MATRKTTQKTFPLQIVQNGKLITVNVTQSQADAYARQGMKEQVTQFIRNQESGKSQPWYSASNLFNAYVDPTRETGGLAGALGRGVQAGTVTVTDGVKMISYADGDPAMYAAGIEQIAQGALELGLGWGKVASVALKAVPAPVRARVAKYLEEVAAGRRGTKLPDDIAETLRSSKKMDSGAAKAEATRLQKVADELTAKSSAPAKARPRLPEQIAKTIDDATADSARFADETIDEARARLASEIYQNERTVVGGARTAGPEVPRDMYGNELTVGGQRVVGRDPLTGQWITEEIPVQRDYFELPKDIRGRDIVGTTEDGAPLVRDQYGNVTRGFRNESEVDDLWKQEYTNAKNAAEAGGRTDAEAAAIKIANERTGRTGVPTELESTLGKAPKPKAEVRGGRPIPKPGILGTARDIGIASTGAGLTQEQPKTTGTFVPPRAKVGSAPGGKPMASLSGYWDTLARNAAAGTPTVTDTTGTAGSAVDTLVSPNVTGVGSAPKTYQPSGTFAPTAWANQNTGSFSANAGVPSFAAAAGANAAAGQAAVAASNRAMSNAARDAYATGVLRSLSRAGDVFAGRSQARLGQSLTGVGREFVQQGAQNAQKSISDQDALSKAYIESLSSGYGAMARDIMDRAGDKANLSKQIRNIGG